MGSILGDEANTMLFTGPSNFDVLDRTAKRNLIRREGFNRRNLQSKYKISEYDDVNSNIHVFRELALLALNPG